MWSVSEKPQYFKFLVYFVWLFLLHRLLFYLMSLPQLRRLHSVELGEIVNYEMGGRKKEGRGCALF
jgi:hypothetical protein